MVPVYRDCGLQDDLWHLRQAVEYWFVLKNKTKGDKPVLQRYQAGERRGSNEGVSLICQAWVEGKGHLVE